MKNKTDNTAVVVKEKDGQKVIHNPFLDNILDDDEYL